MGTGIVVLIVVVVLIVALLAWAVGVYNGLVRLRNLVEEAWRQIDVELTRRHDLIGNLVETVKGYAAHERGTLEDVISARAKAMAPGQSPAQQAESENVLSQALGRLIAVAEAYPDLKASTNFLQLQQQLADTESQLAFARQFYNDAAGQLNTSVSTIPWMFFSGIAGVGKREFYDAPAGQETPPTVQF